MNQRNFIFPLGFMILMAFALPAIVTADDTQVTLTDTTMPVGTITPADTVVTPESPGPDPLGSLAGFFGLRQDIHANRLENANLSAGVRDNRQEIHKNWWDNYNIFGSILVNREQVRADQQLGLETRTENTAVHQQIHEDIANLHQDRNNASVYLADINAGRDELKQNREDQALIHQDVKDLRNATRQNRTVIRENRQEDISLRQTNNATRQEIHQNAADIHADRDLIRSGR
jgi:hypothetical protein